MNPHSVDIAAGNKDRSWIKRAFPVPRILVPSLVSLDISDGVLRYFEFVRTRGKIEPKSHGSLPFPHVRIGGEREKNRSEAIAALRIWAERMRYPAVRAVVHEDEAYVFKVRVPTSDGRELRAAIEAVLEENVPIPPAESLFEYDVISVDEKQGETVVAVSVISRKSISDYVEILESAGLSAVSFETEARAIAHAVFPPCDQKVHAVLYIAERHSVVFIVENGVVAWSSSIEVGSADTDKSIAKTLGIPEQEARAKKLETGFSEAEGDMTLFEAMLPVFSTIRDELGKVLAYWKTQNKRERDGQAISDVVLVGGDSLLSGFARYISITSKLPTRTASVWTNILSVDASIPDLTRRESLDYGTVIGTLL